MTKRKCKRCGKCCDEFPMSEEQIERIAKYLEANPKVKKMLLNTPKIVAPQRKVCPFLRGIVGEMYCAIYPIRPEICQVFGVKGVDEDLECPEGTETTTVSVVEAKELLKVYTEPKGRFYSDLSKYFNELIAH